MTIGESFLQKTEEIVLNVTEIWKPKRISKDLFALGIQDQKPCLWILRELPYHKIRMFNSNILSKIRDALVCFGPSLLFELNYYTCRNKNCWRSKIYITNLDQRTISPKQKKNFKILQTTFRVAASYIQTLPVLTMRIARAWIKKD